MKTITQEKAIIRADFDRIALLADEGWDHNRHYHNFIISHIPLLCDSILEIGCGTGELARGMAWFSEKVLALDLSPEMIRIAREQSRDFPNIEYRAADAETGDFPADSFDCIVAVAALHHLPVRPMLAKLKNALKPGGVLVVLDLYKAATITDFLVCIAAIPVNWYLTLHWLGLRRENRALKQAYKLHGAHDCLHTLPAIRSLCRELLPGARIRRHLLWRYSLVYTRTPGEGQP